MFQALVMRSISGGNIEQYATGIPIHGDGSYGLMWALTVLILLAVSTLVAVVWAVGLTLLFDFLIGVRRRMLGSFLLEHLHALARMELPLARGLGECATRMWSFSRHDVGQVTWRLGAGLPLGDALSLISTESPSGPIAPRRLITPAEAEILRVGETSGNLAEALRLVTQERRRASDARTQTFAGFLYPMGIIIVLSGILSGVFVFIIPKFKRMFEEMDVALPPVTQTLEAGRHWALWPMVVPLLTLAMMLLLFTPLLRRPLGRVRNRFSEGVHKLAYVVPILGAGLRRAALGEFCYELAMLLRVGTPASRALRTLAGGTINPWLRDRIALAAEMTEKGVPLSQALDEARVDPRAAWFARGLSGPEELSRALTRLGEDYSVQTTWTSSVASQVLPVIAIIGVAIAVSIVMFGVFAPLIKLMNSIAYGS